MAKTLIGKSFTGDFAGSLAGNIQIIEKWEVTEEGVPPSYPTIKRDATLEELQAIVGEENATIITANATLNDQNTALQGERDNLTTRLSAAIAALAKVAEADASWDTTPRADVAAVLAAELGE